MLFMGFALTQCPSMILFYLCICALSSLLQAAASSLMLVMLLSVQGKPSKRGKGGSKASATTAAAAATPLGVAGSSTAVVLGQEPLLRILVCAQSNAAIDELVERLALEGVWTTDGTKRMPAMVSFW